MNTNDNNPQNPNISEPGERPSSSPEAVRSPIQNQQDVEVSVGEEESNAKGVIEYLSTRVLTLNDWCCYTVILLFAFLFIFSLSPQDRRP